MYPSYTQINGNDFLLQKKKMTQPLTSPGKCLVTLWYKVLWCVVGGNALDSIIWQGPNNSLFLCLQSHPSIRKDPNIIRFGI